MSSDFNEISAIVNQVFQGFKLTNNGRTPWVSIAIFFLSPAVVAGLLVRFASDADKLASDLMVVLAIYLGFLITMLVPFFNLIDRAERVGVSAEGREKRRVESRFALYRVLYAQIAFAILLSVTSLVLLLLTKQLGQVAAKCVVDFWIFHFPAGAYLILFAKFSAYYCVALGALNLVKILISANALIISDLPSK
jgi:hypothetical protein